MRFQRIHEAVHFHPWLISSAGYASVQSLLHQVMERDEKLDKALSGMVRQRPAMAMDRDGIASISIFGVTGRHLSTIEQACGNTSYDEVIDEVHRANSQGARGILLTVDSPGGQVTGCREAAAAIAESGIPVVVYTDTMMCSAAYYQAAGAKLIVASPSAEVGNIGAIFPWIDQSAAWQAKGLKPDPIATQGADLKSTFKGPSLTDSQREFLQARVDQIGAEFRAHVEAYRLVDDEVWRAGWYSGQRAMDLGLIDGIGNLNDAKAQLLRVIGGK